MKLKEDCSRPPFKNFEPLHITLKFHKLTVAFFEILDVVGSDIWWNLVLIEDLNRIWQLLESFNLLLDYAAGVHFQYESDQIGVLIG